MLLGHLGLGFAGKAIKNKMPIWTLLIAVMIPDLMSLVYAITGTADEKGFWSHSLMMTALFSLISGIIIYFIYRRSREVLIFCGLILSHWLCDFISWPLEAIGLSNRISLFSVETTYGLGLYSTRSAALICEFALLTLGIGLYVYRRKKKGGDPTG